VGLLGGCGSSEDAVPAGDRAVAEAQEQEGADLLEGEVRPCRPPSVLPAAAAQPLLPEGVTLPDGAAVIGAEDEASHVTVTAQLPAAEATPTSLRARYEDELEGAGYEITGGEDEGHESEVFFAFDDGRKGTVQSVRSSCPADTVRLIVSYVK
jgi:hypothetical protein